MSSKVRCQVCKIYFPKDEIKYRLSLGNICSDECLQIHHSKIKKARKIGTGICERCGKSFQRREDSIGKHPHTYCGRECADKTRGENSRGPTGRRRTLKCEQCGRPFPVAPSELSKRRFCSRKCSGLWNSQQPHMATNLSKIDNSGRKNGRYKHGNRVGGHITKKKVRLGVIERDGDWCLYCGKPPRGLHLHRIVYGSEGGQYIVGNCVQLCAYHHEMVHSNKTFWKPKLKNYITQADIGKARIAAEEFRT